MKIDDLIKRLQQYKRIGIEEVKLTSGAQPHLFATPNSSTLFIGSATSTRKSNKAEPKAYSWNS